jgi:hypothetical protein
MKPLERPLKLYLEGQITLHGLFLNLLSLRRKSDIKQILDAMTPDLLAQLRDFVASYRPRAKIFNGPRPSPENIRFVAGWLRSSVPEADQYKPAGT